MYGIYTIYRVFGLDKLNITCAGYKNIPKLGSPRIEKYGNEQTTCIIQIEPKYEDF